MRNLSYNTRCGQRAHRYKIIIIREMTTGLMVVYYIKGSKYGVWGRICESGEQHGDVFRWEPLAVVAYLFSPNREIIIIQ